MSLIAGIVEPGKLLGFMDVATQEDTGDLLSASAQTCTQGNLILSMMTPLKSLASVLAMAPARPVRCAPRR
jgi:hypothetical protein